MLNSMRGSGQSKVMWVIMGMLMLGLTGFGISGLGGGTVRSIGSVGDEPINVNTYALAYRNAAAQFSQQAGRQLSPSELQLFGVQQQVLDAVVSQAALDNETNQKGISVGDDLVRRSILENPQFQGLDGKFDQASYDFYIDRQLGLSPNEFETLLRKENARAILQNAVVGGISGGTTIPMTLMRFAQQERSFEWAALTVDHLGTPVPAPTDAELKSFYDTNSVDYMSPLTRNITFAWLNPADLLDQVAVSEEEIQESYNLQSDRFNKAEQRAVDRVVFPNMKAAQVARDRLDAQKASFSDIVKERGLEEADVDLGEIERGALSKSAADLVFAQTTPGIVGPVESSLGPALFRINAVIGADNTPYAEVRDELRDELAGESARRLVLDSIGNIDDLLASGATLEELAKDTDMTLGKIGYFNGNEDPIAAYDEFRAAALAATKGDFPEVTDLSDGGIFAMRLDSIDQPAAIPLADVRDQLVADWTAAQIQTRLMALAGRLKPGLEKGGDLTVLGLDLMPVDGITRSSFIESLPQGALQQIFELKLGGVTIIQSDEDVVLARLTNITDFDPDLGENDAILARLKSQVDGQIAVDMLDSFANALEKQAGVSLNTAIINQVNTQVSGN